MRHATHTCKHVTVCADLMESNERFNICKEQELIQLEQKAYNAFLIGGSNCHILLKSMLQAHTDSLSLSSEKIPS